MRQNLLLRLDVARVSAADVTLVETAAHSGGAVHCQQHVFLSAEDAEDLNRRLQLKKNQMCRLLRLRAHCKHLTHCADYRAHALRRKCVINFITADSQHGTLRE